MYFTHICVIAILNNVDRELRDSYGITAPIVRKRGSVMKIVPDTRVGAINGKGLVIVAKKENVYKTVSLE